jgi:hypothetical protein
MPVRTCTVSFVAPSDVRYSVDVRAENPYEAIGEGLSLLLKDEWREGATKDDSHDRPPPMPLAVYMPTRGRFLSRMTSRSPDHVA